MKKRLFTVLLMLVLCVGVLSITALADGDPGIVAQGTCGAAGNEDNVTWVLTNDGTITISGTGAMMDFLSGYQPWIANYKDIKKLIVNEGVTNIGSLAFDCCENMTEASLGSTVTTIGENAFRYCYGLEKINLENVVTVEKYAFVQCTSLLSVKLSSVTSIGDYAFGATSAMTKAEIGGTNEVIINKYAFNNCTNLSSITLKNVISIGDNVFQNTAITSADLSGVVTLGSSVFSGVTSLQTVNLGDKIETIGSTAFKGAGLTSITVPASVTSLGSQTFYNCTSLKSANIQASITELPASCFRECTSLTSITLPASLETLKNYAFNNCSSLTEIHLPGTLKSIGNKVFDGCTALTTVYFHGPQEDWEQITVGTDNAPLDTATVYFYSFADEKPTVKAETEKKTGKIKLTITAVDGAKSYKIFVSEQPNGTYTEAATVTGTTYTYSGTPGKTYYFKVQAVNDKGELSGESNIVSKVRLPAQVTSLKATSKKKQVTLKWKKVTGAKKYVIYMSKNGKSGWKKVGTTTKTQYVYKKGTPGKKLYFRVQAVTANGKKGEFSKVVSVKVKK